MADYDSPWKTIVEQQFPDCLAFYFPDLHAAIDWRVEPIFREQELQQITGDSEIGSRRVDKLVDVQLKTGENVWLLIHIEVQRSPDNSFSRRMFIYHYRIFERFDRHPVTLAIVTGRNRRWKPTAYENSQFGCTLKLDFPVVRLVDYTPDTLLNSANPFALVSLAQLAENELTDTISDQYATKLRLIRLLFERGYEKSAIRNLLLFIDWILRLPPELEQQIKLELADNKENLMEYVTSWERMAKAEGLKEGLEEGLTVAVITVLESRFGATASMQMTDKIQTLDEGQLRELLMFSSVAQTFADVSEFIETI